MVRMRSGRVLLVAVVGLGGCVDAFEKYIERSKQKGERAAAEAKGEEFRAQGVDFSIPIPAGYETFTNEDLVKQIGADGLALAASEPKSGLFRGSVVVARAAGPGPADAASCKQVAEELATLTKTTLARAERVTVAGTEVCQWESTAVDDPQRGSTGTVMTTPKSTWVVTCNYDLRDEAARPACTQVLNGWKAT